jgi:hypothetical protein
MSKFSNSVYRGVHIGPRELLDINLYGLAISLAYPSGEEGGVFLVQMIYTCLRCAYRKGGGWVSNLFD